MDDVRWASREACQEYRQAIGKECQRRQNVPGMTRTFRLPDLGEGLHEAQIVEWHINEGDDIRADAPLLSVETDKAVTEVPSPWTGRVGRLCASVGELVKVGAPLVEFDGRNGEARVENPVSEPAVHMPRKRPAAGGSASRAMPAVRVLAKELGLDLASVTGTGPEGAVLARDVAAAFKSIDRHSVPEASEYASLRGLRRSMAINMARSGREIVPATVHEEADLGAWSSRSELTQRLIRAIATATRAEPVLNATFDTGSGLVFHDRLQLGIAVDTKDGLLVPVLRDADVLSAEKLRETLDALIEGARARRLAPDDLKGATFTLSNYGMIAGLHATPVVIPPQLAILGAGRLAERAVANNGQAAVRPILPLSLTYDHRFVTGGEAARFIKAIIEDLQQPQ
jgi:pyruvate dehydrogenase E2 component (dihydrolipoamide acetyltransferase)